MDCTCVYYWDVEENKWELGPMCEFCVQANDDMAELLYTNAETAHAARDESLAEALGATVADLLRWLDDAEASAEASLSGRKVRAARRLRRALRAA
jgi:hypothetical protein